MNEWNSFIDDIILYSIITFLIDSGGDSSDLWACAKIIANVIFLAKIAY